MTVALIDADIPVYAINCVYYTDFDVCYNAYKKKLREIEEAVFVDHSLIAIAGSFNYRDEIYPEYKGKRSKNPERTNFVYRIREQAIADGIAIPADGRETDDLIRIWAEEAMGTGEEYIICSGDKDLFCIPGRHYLIRSEKIVNVSAKEAEKHYWEQILQGDSTDNIPGLPGIGPTKARAMLANCESHEDYEKVVMDQYKKYYGDEWHDWLLSNGKLIHIQKNVNDWFQFDKKKANKV
jgi:5'-3' exonuclease